MPRPITSILTPELRELLAAKDGDSLRDFCEILHPASVGDSLRELEPLEAWEVLGHTDPHVQASIFQYLPGAQKIDMVLAGHRPQVACLIEQMSHDDRVDLLQDIDEDLVENLLPLIAQAERLDIRKLLSYHDDSAGSVMTTDYAWLPADITTSSALEQLRLQAPEKETIYYVYVLDNDRHLVGFISLAELILAKPAAMVVDIMETNVITVPVDEDKEAAAQKLAHYDFIALPVVDESNRLVGIITHDDSYDVAVEAATEDAQRIGAVDPLEEGYLETSILTLTWKRGMWLMILFLGAMLTALVLRQHHDTLESIPWLMAFVPLVISSGGNSGSQSATLVITALTTGNIRLRDWMRVVLREMAMGVLLGGALGLLGFLVVLIPSAHTPPLLDAVVIPLTVLLVVMSGTLIGSVLPLLFSWLGWDPAMMSNPFVAGIIDVLGILIYMAIALWIIV